MPWKCPACSTTIARRAAGETAPLPGLVYRCPVCRLELTANTRTGKLELVPLPSAEPPKRRFAIQLLEHLPMGKRMKRLFTEIRLVHTLPPPNCSARSVNCRSCPATRSMAASSVRNAGTASRVGPTACSNIASARASSALTTRADDRRLCFFMRLIDRASAVRTLRTCIGALFGKVPVRKPTRP